MSEPTRWGFLARYATRKGNPGSLSFSLDVPAGADPTALAWAYLRRVRKGVGKVDLSGGCFRVVT